MISAKEANHKFAVETKLLTDKETINYIVKRNKTFGEKIVNGINRMIQRKIGSKEQKFLAGIRTKWEAALDESRKEGDKKRPSEDGKVQYSLKGYTKDGRPVYISSFSKGMTEEEKIDEFKKRISTIFNLGAVELKTDVKKIFVRGDKFTAQKNIFGDNYLTGEEKLAKIELLYDYADILEKSEFVKRSPEESYIDLSVSPKNNAHKGVKYWYKFKNNIVLDGAGYRVMFNIRDKGKDQYAYLIELKKDEMSDLSNTVYKDLLRTDQTSHNNSISDSAEKDNRKFSIGKEKDREYMAAVESGDMETAQRMVDQAAKAAGYTERLYHQTDAEFTVFEPRHKGAGSRDNETPYGIFMKTSSANIGLKGNKQMELYAKIQNPLVAYDRRSLRKMIESMSPEYRNLKEEIKNIDKEYGEKFENAKTGWTNYITEWRKNNPDAKRTALYDDPEFQRLFDEEDRIIAEWTEKASNLDERAKEEITRTLTDSGYDGIILSRDEGSFGRSTDAYIALDSSQVKSADAVTYDDTGNIIPLSERFDVGDADIRYAFGKENHRVSKADVSYEALIRKPDMKMTILSDQVPYAENGKIDRKRIKSIAKKNVRALNNPNNTERQLFVNLRDLDLEIMITTDGIEHGLTRNEFTAKTTMRIGDILENSIIANELDPRGDELFSYVALGVGIDYEYNLYPVKFIVNVERNNICEVKNIKVYDKLYSSLTKKQMAPARGSTSPSGETRPSHRNHPKISIRNLLDIVKDHYPEILSDDVLSHYGMERPKSEMKGIRYSVGKEKRKVSAEMGELIKAYNAEMMGVFYERSAEDRRELWVFV